MPSVSDFLAHTVRFFDVHVLCVECSVNKHCLRRTVGRSGSGSSSTSAADGREFNDIWALDLALPQQQLSWQRVNTDSYPMDNVVTSVSACTSQPALLSRRICQIMHLSACTPQPLHLHLSACAPLSMCTSRACALPRLCVSQPCYAC